MRRASSLPEQYVPEISEALKKAGLKWEDFKVTDNSCGPHPPQESLAQEVCACLIWPTFDGASLLDAWFLKAMYYGEHLQSL